MEIKKFLKYTFEEVLLIIRKYSVFLRYVASGISSVIVQFTALVIMVELFKIIPTIASGISFVISCIVNYLMLYYWAFKTNGKHLAAILKYTLVTSFTLLLNLLIFWFLTEHLKIWYLISQALATATVALLSYVINSRYTFSRKVEEVSKHPAVKTKQENNGC